LDLIEGKVAKILDKYSLVINRGREHGVTEDMRFVIYQEGETIIDPDGGKTLGKLEIVKGKVKIDNVQEKISTAKSDIFYRAGFQELAFSMNKPERAPLYIDEDENVSQKELSAIRIGDKVRQIPD